MKKMKSILSILLTFCLLFSTCTVALAAEPKAAASEHTVTIEANGVMFRIAEGEQIGTGDGGTVGGSASRTVREGQTLTDAEIYVWHEDADAPYLLGWERHVLKYDASGNEVWDKYTDEEGTLILLSTEEMLNDPIHADTRYIPVWEGKYTTDTYIELHGNGGTFTHAFKNWEYVAICEMGIDSYSSFTETANLIGMGVSDLTDPVHPDGKIFEGWMVYYHEPTEMEYTEPSSGGKLYTSEEIMKFSGTKTGYNLFIAKWAEEDIDPNNAVASDVNTVLGTEPLRQVTIESPGVPFMNHIASGMTSEGERFSTKVRDRSTLYGSGIEIWHFSENEDKFLGWQSIRIEDGVETVQDHLLSNEELLAETIDADYRFVAQWEDGVGDNETRAYSVQISGGGRSFMCSLIDGELCNELTQEIPEGSTLADRGINIRFDDKDENHLQGWRVYKIMNGSRLPLGIVSTEEMLNTLIDGDYYFWAMFPAIDDVPSVEPDLPNDLYVPEKDQYIVEIEGNNVGFDAEQPNYEHPEEIDQLTNICYTNMQIASGMNLADSSVSIRYDEKHDPYFLGWTKHIRKLDSNGNEHLVTVENDNGEPLLFSTEDILHDPITADTLYTAGWKGKYTSNAHLTLHGNGGAYQMTTADWDFIRVTELSYISHSVNNENAYLYSSTNILDLQDPVHPEGKEFEGWAVYFHGPTENEFGSSDPIAILSSEDVLFYTGDVGYTDFIAKWKGEPLNPNDAEIYDYYEEIASTPAYIVSIHNTFGNFFFTNKANKTGEWQRFDERDLFIPENTTLADSGFDLRIDPELEDHFLGWRVYQWTNEETVEAGFITTEELLTRTIGSNHTFEAVWAGESQPDEPQPEEPQPDGPWFSIESNFGSFYLTDGTNKEYVDHHTPFGTHVEQGSTLRTLGITDIIDFKYWDGKREFEGWNVYELLPAGTGDGQTWHEEVLRTEHPITTDELLDYKIEQDGTWFRAAWKGDDADYTTFIEFNACGGNIPVQWDPDNTDSKEYHTTFGDIYMQNGQSVSEQIHWLLSDPVREDYTFEGWLAIDSTKPRYSISTTLYTTDEVMKLPVPANETVYLAKWKEIPIEDYLYRSEYPVSEEYIALLHGGGGTVKILLDYDEGSDEELTLPAVPTYLGQKVSFNDILEMEPDLKKIEIVPSRPNYTFTGWSIYTADRLYVLSAPQNTDISADELTVENMYDLNGESTFAIYKNKTLVKDNVTTEELMAYSSKKNIIYVANWTSAESPEITTQPKTQYAQLGEKAKFTVKAEGEGLTYQWYYKDVDGTKYKKCSGTKATYSLEMTEARKDRKLYCIITDKHGNEVKSKTVYMRMAASIKTEPKTAYTQLGDKAKFTVKAVGDDLTYQWYYKSAGSSKYKKASCTKATYTITTTEDRKDRAFYCIVKDKYGNEVKSKTVYMRLAATITSEPKTQYVQLDEKAKFTVKAVGDGLTYQWYYKSAGSSKYKKASCTKATYTITMTEDRKDRKFYCIIKDKYGNEVKTKTVTMKMAASIKTEPKSVKTSIGKKAKFTVKAVGDDLTYQWYYKDTDGKKYKKASCTKATYSIELTKARNGRKFYCVVTDKYGNTVKSKTVSMKKK